jgi:microcystin-dependent protein
MPSYNVNSGDQSVLAEKINATQTTGIIFAPMNINGDIVAWSNITGGVVEISEQADATLKREWMYYTGGSVDADNYFTPTGVVRGIARDTTDVTTGSAPLAQTFSKGAVVRFVTFHDLLNKKANLDRASSIVATWTFATGGQILFTNVTTQGLVNQRLTTTQRDAVVTWTDGAQIYNTTVGQTQWREGGSWVTNAAGGTLADASTTVAGKVEIATDAEIRSEATTGGTGALVVIPASATAVLKDDRIVLKDATELTIATGAITVTQPYHKVDTESDAAGDDLITITAAVGTGEMVYLRLENSARIVNIKDGDGNIVIPGGDYTLTDPDEVLCFLYNGTNWLFIGSRATAVGAMQIWTTDTAPTGWTLCAGGTLSRTTYSNLFDRIGTVYGTGDGSTTFTLPDMRGRMALGQDDMGGSSANRVVATEADTLGSAHGAETITLDTTQIPSHSHTLSLRLQSTTNGAGGQIAETGGSNAGPTGSTGGGLPHNNMPPNLTLNFIIKQ